MDEIWLSVDDICKHLNVSNETDYNWILNRGMPGYRVGRGWKFKAREVDEWVKSGRATGPDIQPEQTRA